MKKRVYSTELKEQAVRLSYQRENIKELADELGIDVQRIYKWRSDGEWITDPNNEVKEYDGNGHINSVCMVK